MSQTVAGALVGGALGAYGKKVTIPDLPAIDPQQIQATTIANNTAAIPGLEQLGSQVNEFNSKQQLAMLERALNFLAPGQLQKAQGIANSQLNGEVPDDVRGQIQRQSVAGAYGRGYGPGSQIASNDYLRNFGLSSMGIQQQGLQNFGALANMAPKTPMFDMTSMFYTPQQRLAFAFQDREANFNVNLMKAQVAAAPDPNMVQLAQGFDNFFKTWASVGMGAMGGSVQGSGAPQPGGTGGQGGMMLGGGGSGGVEGSGAGGFNFGSMGTTQPQGGGFGTGE